MADRIGVDQGQYSRWEKGVYVPTNDYHVAIEMAFNLPDGRLARMNSARKRWEKNNPSLDQNMLAIGPVEPALVELLDAVKNWEAEKVMALVGPRKVVF
jgi:hypothetical protein